MFLQFVFVNINYRKRVETIANHLLAKRIRCNMGLFLLPIHSCKNSSIPHTYSHVKNLVPQVITHSGDKPNTTSVFNLQSKISNLPSSIITH